MGAGYGSQFTRNTVQVGDYTIPYLQGGHGQPLVYLHGLGGWGKWETYHLAMGITNLVYAPQLPGWQDRQIPATITSVCDYADVMTAFLDAVGLKTVNLVGHSFGGWVALRMALERPERIAKLVVVDAMGLEVSDASAADLAALDEAAFLKAAFTQTGVVVIRGDFGGISEDVRAGQEFQQQWHGRNLVIQLVRGQYADPELTRRLPAITADALVVWGREDGIVPRRHGEVLAAALPRAKLAVIAEAGHTPMREKRETFQRIVRDFLIGQYEEPERDAMVKG